MMMAACRLRSWRRPTRTAFRARPTPARRSSRMQVALAFHRAAAVPLHLLASRERRFSPHPRPTPAGRGRWTHLGHGPSPTRSAFVTPHRVRRGSTASAPTNGNTGGDVPAESPHGRPRRTCTHGGSLADTNPSFAMIAPPGTPPRRRRGCSSQPTAVSSNPFFHARTSRLALASAPHPLPAADVVRARKKASVGQSKQHMPSRVGTYAVFRKQ